MFTKQLYQKYKQITNSTLIRSSGIYTVASFINASIPFLLVPILTTKLTPSDYGIVVMFTTVVAFIAPFVDINMEAAIGRKFYSKENISEYIGNCFYIFLASFSLSFFLLFLFKDIISSYTMVPENWIVLIPLYCITLFVCKVVLTLWQVREKPVKYASFQIVQSLMNAGLTILFVVLLKQKWQGRLEALIISSLLLACIAFFILIKNKDIVFKFKKDYILHALKFGGGIIPHTIGGTLIVLTNRFYLTNMINIGETGLYSVAFQISSIISFFTISFNNAFVPWLYKKLTLNNPTDKIKIVKYTYLYFIGITLAGLVYYLFTPLLFKLFINPQFYDAKTYVFWLILGSSFQGMYFMVTNYIFYAEKTHIQAIITLSIGILNIPINYFCIKYFGGIGAAISYTIIYIIFFITTWLFSAKVYKMPWSLTALKA